MHDILTIAYESCEWLVSFLPFLIIWTMYCRKGRKQDDVFSWYRNILLVVFALYIIGVFYVTGAGTLYDAIGLRVEYIAEHINLVPFSQRIDVKGYVLNIILLMPFGFLLPMIWDDMRKPIPVILSGFAFSLLIEVSQILSSRGTDIDDLILNTLGAALGFSCYRAWDRITKSKFQSNGKAVMTLPVSLIVLFLSRFLLLYRMGLIRLFYG